MSALIEFDHVCKYYQMGDTLVKAADHISMQINKGEFVAIVGQSGSGKSIWMCPRRVPINSMAGMWAE